MSGGIAGVCAIGCAIWLFPVFPDSSFWTLPFLAAYAVGCWACRVEPDNRAARMLLLFGVVSLAWIGGSAAVLLWVRTPGDQPGFVLVNTLLQMAGLVMATTICAMLVSYPDGVRRLAAERWLVGVLTVVSVCLPLVLLLTRADLKSAWILEWAVETGALTAPEMASPWYIAGLDAYGSASSVVLDSALGLFPVLGVLVAVARFRVLDAAQRTRMGWPLLAALLLILMAVGDLLVANGQLATWTMDIVEIVGLTLIPVSFGIGIAKPELFDVLGTVRHTISYSALAIAIVAVYVAAAGVMGAAIGRDNLQVAVVVAVLASLALDPLRRRLVRHAGRLAYGEQISRDALLRRLGATLEHTLDRDELMVAIAATAREGLGAEWVRLTLSDAEPVHDGRVREPGEHPAATVRLRHGTEDLGVISCGPLVRGRVDQHALSLLDTLAQQAGLALTNARLAEELQLRLHELEASRARLVTAEESARRQLERDLHDGAQQDLAALLTRIALARNQLKRGDPDRLAGTLETLQSDAQHALSNLRELVTGIHATVLADRGLVEAIAARVARLPLRVDVQTGPGVREGTMAESVEGAAYFTVCEGLANTLKHSRARRATVKLRLEDGLLHIVVADDGRGFDTATRNVSGGLAGLTDRLAALGGTLEVRSRPGAGTTLTAAVPSPS